MKTTLAIVNENRLSNILSEMEDYELIMSSFNFILAPDYFSAKNEITGLSDIAARKVVIKVLSDRFNPLPSNVKENETYQLYWPLLSDADSFAEKKLKKAAAYMEGLYEVCKLRFSLFLIFPDDLGRIIYLLTSNEKEKQFGGLRSLHLSKYQADALIPIASEIGEFIASLNEFEDAKIFPEKEIILALKTATDSQLERISYLLNSGEDKMIYGGLRSLSLTKKQVEICLNEGIDTIIQMVSKETEKRRKEIFLEKLNSASKELTAAREKLISAGFDSEEITEMLKCTKAYKEYAKYNIA